MIQLEAQKRETSRVQKDGDSELERVSTIYISCLLTSWFSCCLCTTVLPVIVLSCFVDVVVIVKCHNVVTLSLRVVLSPSVVLAYNPVLFAFNMHFRKICKLFYHRLKNT